MGLHIWALNRKHLVPRPGDEIALVPTPRELPAQGVLWTLPHHPELRARDLNLKEVAKGGCVDPRGRTLGAELDQHVDGECGPCKGPGAGMGDAAPEGGCGWGVVTGGSAGRAPSSGPR